MAMGTGLGSAAALIIPASEDVTLASLQSVLDKANLELPSQSRLSTDRIILLAPGDTFVVSPKGR